MPCDVLHETAPFEAITIVAGQPLRVNALRRFRQFRVLSAQGRLAFLQKVVIRDEHLSVLDLDVLMTAYVPKSIAEISAWNIRIGGCLCHLAIPFLGPVSQALGNFVTTAVRDLRVAHRR
jgi:hypothetical protein